MIAGVDEAGRGPVIGPLIVVALLFEDSSMEELKKIGARDSKKLSEKKRESLFNRILSLSKASAIIKVTPDEITRWPGTMNELEVEAFARALNALLPRPSLVYLDAVDVVEERFAMEVGRRLVYRPKLIAEHRADSKYLVVSAASIVAKVIRDREIKKLHELYGNFGSGYPGDPLTREFLIKYYREHGDFPPIVRRNWKTLEKIRRLAGRPRVQRDIREYLRPRDI